MKQTCVLVLGMHRSGTSALTGVLGLLDIYLGSELMEANFANEKGYFENDILYKINEELLSQINSSWDDVFFNEEKIESLEVATRLKDVIKSEFEYADVFAIKDPRLVFLFPVYEKILSEFDVAIKIIIPYRNPVEVARSLHKRDGISLEKGMLLWAYHFFLAEKFSRGYERVFVGFDNLMSDTAKVMHEISSKLSLDLTDKYARHQNEISGFLDPGLKHHNISIENLSSNVPNIIKNILSLRDGFNNEDLSEKFDALRNQLFGYQKIFYHDDIVNLLSEGESAKSYLQAKEVELIQLKQNLQVKESELGKKTQRVREVQEKLGNVRQTLQARENELHRKENALSKTRLLMQERSGELEKAKHSIHVNENEIESLKTELTDVYMSKSWKLTKVLRVFMRLMRK